MLSRVVIATADANEKRGLAEQLLSEMEASNQDEIIGTDVIVYEDDEPKVSFFKIPVLPVLRKRNVCRWAFAHLFRPF